MNRTAAHRKPWGNNSWAWECEAWNQLLDCLENENHNLLNRLSRFLRENQAAGLLKQAEYFQDACIAQSRELKRTRTMMINLDGLMRGLPHTEAISEETSRLYGQMKKEINRNEKSFHRLKTKFDHYLAGQ